MIFNCSAVGNFQSKIPYFSASKTGSTAVFRLNGWGARAEHSFAAWNAHKADDDGAEVEGAFAGDEVGFPCL